MSIDELKQKLNQEELDRLNSLLETLEVPSMDELLTFKIHLEGTKFQGLLPSDLGYAIWKLQQSYYHFVSLVLYDDPNASLSAEEKERYLLEFRIEKGSTIASTSYGELIPSIIEKVADKMEAWHIFAFLIAVVAAYAGKNYLDYKKNKHDIDTNAEVRKHQIDADVEKNKQNAELLKDVLHDQANVFKEAYNIGKNGRTAVLKTTGNISKATIGLQEYSSEDIAKIKRREPSKKTSDLKLMHVVVEDINTADDDNLALVLKEKETQIKFKAKFDIDDNDPDFADEEDTFTQDILWNSARYRRYFWAKIALSIKNDKIVRANLLEVADNKADLEPTEDIG